MDVKKERRIAVGPWRNLKTAPVTRTTLRTAGPALAALGSERHRYAFVWPVKLGAGSIMVDGNNKCTPSWKAGEILLVSTKFRSSV